MDVDGTLTDGKIYIGSGGEMFKAFDIKDGYGIHDILPEYGITPIIITSRESKLVEERCRELNIRHIFQGCHDKKEKLIEIADALHIEPNKDGRYADVAYIGDDLADLPAMSLCQYRGCPSDAAEEIKAVCDYVSGRAGGDGAVRDYIEWLTKS